MTSKLGWYAFTPASSQQTNFEVVSFDGIERLGEAYSFDVDVASASYDLDLNELLGKPATLTMQPWGGEWRYFHGVITKIEVLREIAQDMLLYRARLEPSVVRLRQSLINCAYVDSAKELDISNLIKRVFDKNGLQSGIDYELKLGSPVMKRSFVMQYEESYWDFINRWLEFEGVFFYFDQGDSDGSERIVFVDDIASLSSHSKTMMYRPYGSIDVDQYKTSVISFGQRQVGLAQSVTLQNYNYRRGQDMVTASSSRSQTSWGSNIVFGGNIKNNQQANAYVKFRTEALNAQSLVFQGQALAGNLNVGSVVTLQEHPRKSFNQRYRIVSVRHRGSQTGFGLAAPEINGTKVNDNFYIADFEAIVDDTPFRLPLKTPWPHISGYLPAQIDGEDSNVPTLDEFGRYKVVFLFGSSQHDQMKGSTWVRFAGPYNGPGEAGNTGFHFPLVRGAEVMIAFMNGDPDQPIIVAAINNSLTPSSVNNVNSTINRIVSRTGNELHMDDTAETSGVRIQSSNHSVAVIMGAFGGRFGRDND